jgi:hypothetical protein
MVLIEAGDDQGAKDSQDRGSPPESPAYDGHLLKSLPPAVEESETDRSVTGEMAHLPDEVMYLVPVCRACRAKESHPQRIKPLASVSRRHRRGRLEGDYQKAQPSRNPIQQPVQRRVPF